MTILAIHRCGHIPVCVRPGRISYLHPQHAVHASPQIANPANR